jgi:hypothetical protein
MPAVQLMRAPKQCNRETLLLINVLDTKQVHLTKGTRVAKARPQKCLFLNQEASY